ncbi:hypothetical protein V5799_030751 [Amblyomma americanum]|uniref:mRNA splicing factor n=1 Tax=Amblyomma americanum TaxID=6943 RepID=A0AAQ4EMA4_AMBAM
MMVGDLELELRLARFEDLMDRRPLLLNSVLLRQNPHNVHEWLKRVKLFEGKPREIINTFTEAVQTIDPKLATGKLHVLWVSFAKFYEENDQIEDARIIFEKATQVPFTKVEDLAHVWCEWAEMELRHEKLETLRKKHFTVFYYEHIPFHPTLLLGEHALVDISQVLVSVLQHMIFHLRSLCGCICGLNYLARRNHEGALKLMQKATAMPSRKVAYHDQSEPVQFRVYKSLKVWSLYADLEESFGTFKSTKAVYDRIIDLKIATPQIIINYGLFLEENNYFEEAFKAYEKGIALFKWPNVFDIWNTYLTKFLKRYGGTKLERARDLFEQCLEGCPAKFAKSLYLLYAKLEEEHGLARHAMGIYDRGCKAVLPEEQFEMFNIYILKAAEIYGLTHTREIYERAIEVLPDSQARLMCIRFADLERKLGEIDRARAIYAHCSQMCDPRTTADFWNTWKEFEVHHGNEDTMREMLRIKRSVQAMYNTQVNFMTAQMLSATAREAAAAAGNDEAPKDSMQQLEAAAKLLADEARKDAVRMPGKDILFVRGGTTEDEQSLAERSRTTNPDEINIDDEEGSDDDQQIEEVAVEQRSVPEEVFGDLKK